MLCLPSTGCHLSRPLTFRRSTWLHRPTMPFLLEAKRKKQANAKTVGSVQANDAVGDNGVFIRVAQYWLICRFEFNHVARYEFTAIRNEMECRRSLSCDSPHLSASHAVHAQRSKRKKAISFCSSIPVQTTHSSNEHCHVNDICSSVSVAPETGTVNASVRERDR